MYFVQYVFRTAASKVTGDEQRLLPFEVLNYREAKDTRNHQLLCIIRSIFVPYLHYVCRTGNALEVGSWPIPESLLPLALHYSNSSSPLLPLILFLPFLTVLVRRNPDTRSLPPLFTRIGFLSLDPFSITFISFRSFSILSRFYTFVTPRIAISTLASAVNKRTTV
ncbi:hypothetical protein F4815DRAFT_102633 [Daldinia loculata]|nr:hypothetical protein F4815DRAFT_102633 [Daldinia loculata]